MTDSTDSPSTNEVHSSENTADSSPSDAAGQGDASQNGAETSGGPESETSAEETFQPLAPLPPPTRRVLIIGNALAIAAILWDLLDRLTDGLHQNDSAFRGFDGQIPTPFYAVCLGLAGLLGLFVLYRLIRFGLNREDKTFRLLPIAAVLILSADWFFIRAFEQPGMPADAVAKITLRFLEARPLVSEDGLFPKEPKFYADATAQFPPPYWKNGEKLTRWNIRILEDCTTSVTQISMDEPGTLIVCLSSDRTKAWISAVTLDRGSVGAPALAQDNGTVLAAEPRIIQKKKGDDAAMNPAAFF